MQSEIQFLPDQASTFAPEVDAFYIFLIGLTVFFTVVISLGIIYFVIRYRRRSEDEIPHPVAGSHVLETLWTVIPFLISMVIFAWGAKIYFAQYRAPVHTMDIAVVGKQWMWKFQHMTGQREINELHVPVGTKVKLNMTTEDVLHSFFVPAFRAKMDVVPGRHTIMWFEATKTGRFHLFCAEYCGLSHSGMIGSIVVMEPTEFQAWLSGNINQESPITAGEKRFNDLGCATCHSADNQAGRGPGLGGIFGSTVQLAGGQSVTADETYIRESILNPSAKIVAGYQPIMPTFQGQVSEEQLLQLISYIKSLNPSQTSGPATTAPAQGNNQGAGSMPSSTDMGRTATGMNQATSASDAGLPTGQGNTPKAPSGEGNPMAGPKQPQNRQPGQQ
jgi:cytochrome c oxidase subunit II